MSLFIELYYKSTKTPFFVSVSKIIIDGPENELQLTQNTQPAILTVSYSIFKVLDGM